MGISERDNYKLKYFINPIPERPKLQRVLAVLSAIGLIDLSIFIPRPKGLGDIAMSLVSVRHLSLPPYVRP